MSAKPFLWLREPNSRTTWSFTQDASPLSTAEVILAPFHGNKQVTHLESTQLDAAAKDININTLNSLPSFEADKETYIQKISDVVDELRQGNMNKVVLSRPHSVAGSVSALELFQKLEKQYPDACVFLFYTEESGCWMGATPEQLLRVENGIATAASLAGTRPAGSTEPWGEKELEEQRIVTDEIKTVFERCGLTAITETELKTKQAGKIEHLFTEISAKMPNGLKPSKLAEKLHPTPAVGGLPKNQAIEYILQNEGYDRSYYTGYFGIETPEVSRFYVNLRTMQLFKNGLVLYAGGGITAASDPEAEWEETERKMRTLLDVIED